MALEAPALVRRALQLSGISEKEAYLWMGLDQRRFSKWMCGSEAISLNRLAKLPVKFHQWLHVLGSKEVGLPEELELAPKLARAQRRMARMEMAPAEAQKEIA